MAGIDIMMKSLGFDPAEIKGQFEAAKQACVQFAQHIEGRFNKSDESTKQLSSLITELIDAQNKTAQALLQVSTKLDAIMHQFGVVTVEPTTPSDTAPEEPKAN